jgi:hypothetical protein
MFYPLFVLVAFASAIPLKIAEQMVYLAASFLIARVVAGRSGNERLLLFLFGSLAFNPVLWSAPLARVVREGIYLSLCLATVTLVLAISFPQADGVRRGPSWKLAIALGLVGAAFWLTREEGIWLVPAIAVPLAIMVFQVGRLRPIASKLKPLGVSLAVFAAVLVLVAATNLKMYGVFRLTDFQSGNFMEAYGAISRISPDTWRRYVVFPKSVPPRANCGPIWTARVAGTGVTSDAAKPKPRIVRKFFPAGSCGRCATRQPGPAIT